MLHEIAEICSKKTFLRFHSKSGGTVIFVPNQTVTTELPVSRPAQENGGNKEWLVLQVLIYQEKNVLRLV